MRRLLAPLVAVALCALVAPARADEPKGTLEITSRGPAKDTVRLPGVRYDDSRRPELLTPNPYLVLAVAQRGYTKIGVAKSPAAQARPWTYPISWDKGLTAEPASVRVLTEGPLRVRVPVVGIRGTKRIDLGSRLSGGRVVIRDLVPDAAGIVESMIPFELPEHSVLLHGYVRRAGLFVVSDEGHCTRPRGTACGSELNENVGSSREWSVLHSDFTWGGPGRAFEGWVYSADFAVELGTVTHYILVLPVA